MSLGVLRFKRCLRREKILLVHLAVDGNANETPLVEYAYLCKYIYHGVEIIVTDTGF